MNSKGKLGPLAVVAAFREIRRTSGDSRPLAVGGAKELVPILARELRAGGDANAVREGGGFQGAAALIWVGAVDEEVLRGATRAKVPIVAVTDEDIVPYVLAQDVVSVPPGQGFPLDEIATKVARALGDRGPALAARLPVLRGSVCEHLISSTAKKNAAIAAAVFVPGVDLPLLTMNQIRMVLRIALAYGEELDQNRALEIAGVVGAGYGFRTLAREALDLVPIAGWAVKGAVAFGGTRAVGAAAVKLLEVRK
jgi:uncharacterized protein (DUF697 family)